MFLSIRQIRLRLKLFFVIVGLLLFAYFALASWLYYDQYQRLTQYNERSMGEHNQDMHLFLDLFYEEKYKKIQESVQILDKNIQKKGGIDIKKNYVSLKVINEETQTESFAQVSEWRIEDKIIQQNTTFIDSVAKLTNCDHTIFQKIPQGMLRVATTLRGQINERQINIFLPNDWAMVKAINEGKSYTGRVLLNKKNYIIAYLPLRKDGNIVGMISAILPEYDFKQIEKRLKAKKYLASGHIYFFNLTGKVILHRDSNAIRMDLNKTTPALLEKAKAQKKGYYRYYLNFKNVQGWRYQYFSYYAKADFYTAIVLPEQEFVEKPLAELRNLLVTSFILFFAIIIVIVYFFSNSFTKPIAHISHALGSLAVGKHINFKPYKRKDEIGTMSVALNELIKNSEKSASFAKSIGNGDFTHFFESTGSEDTLGNALLQMREDLQKSAEATILRNWITNQNAYFSEIIRKHQENYDSLATHVLESIMQRLGFVQGAFYMIDKEAEKLTLLSAYAYNRQKLVEREFSLSEGILGEVYQNKQVVEIKQLPEGYLKFLAGVGEISPSYLLVLPCEAKSEVLVILELAHFNALEDYKVKFLKEFSYILGTTFANIRANELTLRYLKEAQEATEELRQQDEELRQNMEELAAAREHSIQQEEEMRQILKKSNMREQMLKDSINALREKEAALQQRVKELEEKLRG